MHYAEVLIATLTAYLFGSLSSAIIVCRLSGYPDPRTQGSNNPGATNVLRIAGKSAAILTLAGDILKGVVPVLIAKAVGFSGLTLSLVIVAAFLGHLYPLYFGFKGGKGVATAFGCLISLSFPIGLCLITAWLVTAILFRYSSLSSLVAALLAPIFTWYFTASAIYTITTVFMSVLLIYRHRHNIRQLIAGIETPIGKKKS